MAFYRPHQLKSRRFQSLLYQFQGLVLPIKKVMVLRLSFLDQTIRELPALAWLFTRPAADDSKLLHGSGVNVFPNGFFEGCIAGDVNGDLLQIGNVFGSGMKIQYGKYVFVTPSHPLEGMFFYRYEDGFALSNSLSFLLEYHRLWLPWDPLYGAKFASIVQGIEAYEKLLFRTPKGEVLRIVYDNLIIDPDGEYELVRKPSPPAFGTYAEYVEYLKETLRQAFADARREGRATIYRPLATCSTGYDSAAVAALAKRVGCREAVTLIHARGGAADSGRPVAETLGLNVREYEYLDHVEQSFQEVAEFLATGMGGEDYWFQTFSDTLSGSLLLTAFWGGDIWTTSGRHQGAPHSHPKEVLPLDDLGGASLQEFRLRMDFIHIPAPIIGGRRSAEICSISSAAEMEPYSLHKWYDRPIPRRILEESGVPRAMFGQKKKAASVLLFLLPGLLRGNALEEYERLKAKQHIPMVSYAVQTVNWWLRFLTFRGLMKVESFLPWTVHLTSVLGDWRVFEHSRPGAALQFCVAVTQVRERYEAALGKLDQNARAGGRI